jgi:uncharacterized membrane protein
MQRHTTHDAPGHGAGGAQVPGVTRTHAADAAGEDGRTGVMAGVVHRNIEALVGRQREHSAERSVQERIADRVTVFTGSMRFVYIHVVLYGVWIVWNLGWLGLPRFDRSFVVLAMEASVEAIFLSTFVLISQNRMNIEADARANLDVQISLLSEHEVTRLVTLVAAIARKLDIDEAHMPEIPELEEDVRPEEVLDELEHHQHDLGAT